MKNQPLWTVIFSKKKYTFFSSLLYRTIRCAWHMKVCICTLTGLRDGADFPREVEIKRIVTCVVACAKKKGQKNAVDGNTHTHQSLFFSSYLHGSTMRRACRYARCLAGSCSSRDGMQREKHPLKPFVANPVEFRDVPAFDSLSYQANAPSLGSATGISVDASTVGSPSQTPG